MASSTLHGAKRMKCRMGLNMSAADRQANLALEKGIRFTETTGSLRKWIRYCIDKFSSGNGENYIAYNSKLFVFTYDCQKVITVLSIPSCLLPNLAVQMKQKRSREGEK